MEQDVILGLELQRLLVGFDGLGHVAVLLGPDFADLVQEHEALLALEHVVEDLSLVGGNLLPVVELGVDVDQRVERRPMPVVDAQRLLEVVDGLAICPCSRLMQPSR